MSLALQLAVVASIVIVLAFAHVQIMDWREKRQERWRTVEERKREEIDAVYADGGEEEE